MSDTSTQPTVAPNNGASNASEFQPTTQNPQNVTSNLYQQQTGIQDVKNTQEVLNDQKNARISIAYQPAAPNMPVAKAHETPVIFIFSLICGVLIVLLVIGRKYGFWRRSLPGAISEPTEAAPTEVQPTDVKPTQQAQNPAPTTRKTVKKKPVKKSKRRHR